MRVVLKFTPLFGVNFSGQSFLNQAIDCTINSEKNLLRFAIFIYFCYEQISTMKRDTNHIKAAILEAVDSRDSKAYNIILECGIAALPILAEHLSKDLPIEMLERFESVLKAILRSNLNSVLPSETARQLALFQKNLGFLLKYKSYAIKASTPLGYSIFIQNEREGFSYQRHVSHKTEVFHILEVKRGGYVFICDFEDWIRYYDKDSFSAWLSGQSDDRYDQYRLEPNPGDVFVIDRLNVVHTVIGCVLEEFATVSTDMVDRLQDQNAGKPIPAYFNRHYAQERLRAISTPRTSRRIENRIGMHQVTEIVPIRISGGQVTPLARTSIISASHYLIEPFQTSELQIDEQRIATIHIKEGAGRVIIADREEVKSFTPPTILICAGDVLMIPANTYYGFVNEDAHPLKVSEHKVPPEAALF